MDKGDGYGKVESIWPLSVSYGCGAALQTGSATKETRGRWKNGSGHIPKFVVRVIFTYRKIFGGAGHGR